MSDMTGPAATTALGAGIIAGSTLLENAWGFSPYTGSLAPVAAQVAARGLFFVGAFVTADGLFELATGKSVIRGVTGRSFNEHVQHQLGLEPPTASGVSLRGR